MERLLSVEKVEEYIRYVLDRIGRNRRGGLSEQLVAFIRAYSFYGWKNTNERNIKKTREFYREKARKAGQPWRAPELKKIQLGNSLDNGEYQIKVSLINNGNVYYSTTINFDVFFVDRRNKNLKVALIKEDK